MSHASDDDWVTKCVCGDNELVTEFMVQCDRCDIWEHGECVGIESENAVRPPKSAVSPPHDFYEVSRFDLC